MKIKRFLCALLAASMLFCLAACGDKTPDGSETTTFVAPADKTFPWPDNAFFADIPAVAEYVKNIKQTQNDQGYVYEITVDEIDYKTFREYIEKLEDAGFGIYKVSPLSDMTTEDMLPEKLAEDKFNASWQGNRRGVYVAAFWYGDEYYEKYGLPEDSNLRLTFYTYNAFNID